MIFNISCRTDIPAFYTPWLISRLREGFVLVRNPYDRRNVVRYDFHEGDVLCFVSKDFSPLIPYLGELKDRFRIHLYYTVTGYGRDVERNVPPVYQRVETFRKASSIVGSGNISWRYDPILIWRRYDVSFHKRAFAYYCRNFSGCTGRCIFSFVSLYRRITGLMPGIREVGGFEKKEILSLMAEESRASGIILQSCGMEEVYQEYGVVHEGCISPPVLGMGADTGARRGMRAGCLCMENRDIGAYGTCRHGCLYCYAGSEASDTDRCGNLGSPLLSGSLEEGDVVRCFSEDGGQLTLDL